MDGRLRRSWGALAVEIVMKWASWGISKSVTLFGAGKNLGDAECVQALAANTCSTALKCGAALTPLASSRKSDR